MLCKGHDEGQQLFQIALLALLVSLGKIGACAVVYDIRTVPPGKREKTDAIAVELDHRGGMSIVVVYPYAIAADKKAILGESYAAKSEGKIFAALPRQ